jgi:putative membrane protein
MSTGYLWIKAFHLIFVITWMAALFYLPRLFIYHSGATDQISTERFKIMERKLYVIIMRPSMILATAFGLWALALAWDAFASSGWLWIKLLAVVGLLGYHHYCARMLKAFAADTSLHSERFYRIFNEVPAIALIIIVIMVVVKPF